MTDLRQTQTRRRLVLTGALVALSVVMLLTRSYWSGSGSLHKLIESLGIVAIVVCVVGRVWCSLYIGGRKSTEVVTVGPYSVVRNPLYLFSIIGAAGIGAVVGSIVLAALAGLGCYLVFRTIAAAEERHLAARHGQVYLDYVAKVPRFLPDPRLWRDVDSLLVRPRLVGLTLLDASWFLLAIPALEAVEWLQDSGYLAAPVVLP